MNQRLDYFTTSPGLSKKLFELSNAVNPFVRIRGSFFEDEDNTKRTLEVLTQTATQQ